MQPASQNGWYNMGDGFGGVPPLKTEQLSPALSPRELRSPARNNVRTPQSLMPPNNMNYTPPNPSPITPRSDQHPSLQMSIPQFTQSGPSAFYSYVTKAEGINFPPITQSDQRSTHPSRRYNDNHASAISNDHTLTASGHQSGIEYHQNHQARYFNQGFQEPYHTSKAFVNEYQQPNIFAPPGRRHSDAYEANAFKSGQRTFSDRPRSYRNAVISPNMATAQTENHVSYVEDGAKRQRTTHPSDLPPELQSDHHSPYERQPSPFLNQAPDFQGAPIMQSDDQVALDLSSPQPQQEYITNRASKSHKRNIDPPRNGEGKMVCTASPRFKECDGLTFERKCEWNKHMDKHERPYKCKEPGCENLQGFTYSGGLLRHEREVHKAGGTRGPFYCPEHGCKRASQPFSRKENLNEHLRRVHRRGSAESPGDTSGVHDVSASAQETGLLAEQALHQNLMQDLQNNAGLSHVHHLPEHNGDGIPDQHAPAPSDHLIEPTLRDHAPSRKRSYPFDDVVEDKEQVIARQAAELNRQANEIARQSNEITQLQAQVAELVRKTKIQEDVLKSHSLSADDRGLMHQTNGYHGP